MTLLILIIVKCRVDDNATDGSVDRVAKVCLHGACGGGLVHTHTSKVGQRESAVSSKRSRECEAVGLVVIDDRHRNGANAVQAARTQTHLVRVTDIEAQTTSDVVTQTIRTQNNQLIINTLSGIYTSHIAKCNQVRVTTLTRVLDQNGCGACVGFRRLFDIIGGSRQADYNRKDKPIPITQN